jgi:hypothetical protein
MLVKTKIRFFILSVFIAALVFTTCDAPMGMGPPIDWEAPILTMDPVSNPFYVKKGSILSGTVTDNTGVERIVFTDSKGNEIFPVIRDGDRWIIELLFTEEQNGEKIVGEIRAFDKMNNTGDRSAAIVTMIIDILPPIVKSITIKRTDTQISYLEPLSVLKEFEITDRLGERKKDRYKYQNGWFHIDCVTDDEETKVEIVSLDFYDIREPKTLLKSFKRNEDSSNYFPRWTIKEEDIINAGAENLSPEFSADYKTRYYNNFERYYYRVVINAFDMSENESVEEEEGFLCLWARSDEPKGILDPVMGTIVSRGTSLPVEFFDDDMLLWAYAGLLTEDQWNGLAPVAPGATIPLGTNDAKLLWLKERLTGANGDSVTLGAAKGPVYNWLYDKHNSASYDPSEMTSEPVNEIIQGKKLDDQTVWIFTGNGENDYGQYVLFTIAADKKLAPHDKNGPEWTNKDIWRGRALNISVIDENAPLIVFDTVKAKQGEPEKLFSPEENTFPELKDGEFFNIVGYTLRENGAEAQNPSVKPNTVTRFRMAWIPFGMPDLPGKPKGGDGYIKEVQNALKDEDFAGMPSGVQYWNFAPTPGKPPAIPVSGKFYDEGNENIDDEGMWFRKQSFFKTFSVLGGQDDVKPEYDNFTYNGKLENETKLFIFYAVDNMGHEVFRQLRILGNKTPPDIVVYDFTNHLENSLFYTDPPALPKPGDLPNPNDSAFFTNGVFDETKYYPVLKTANEGKYAAIKSVIDGVTIPSKDDITIPFQIYPRGTVVKFYIASEKQGITAVEKVTMKDITFSNTGQPVGSIYDADKRDLTFCEFYPDVTQRTFLFEATDKLGNVARVQRTVAVTNAAKLENITTTTQSGTYGVDYKITLQANFSSQVYVTGGIPKLNIRYFNSANDPVYYEIPCTNPPGASNPASVLEFDFIVPVNTGGSPTGGTGIIETLYDDSDNPASPPFDPPIIPPDTKQNKRPIIIPVGAKIVDANRGDSAFIPGYKSESITMPNWSSAKNSLQERKSIKLDGVRPRVTSVTVGGKTISADNTYYFKNGETLEFTLKANEPVRASAVAPVLLYDRLNASNAIQTPADTTNFKYQRPSGQTDLVFSLSVNDVAADGRVNNFRLNNVAGIVDNADNTVESTTVNALLSLVTPTANPTIYIKKSTPAAPVANLAGTAIGANPNTVIYYNTNPILTIANSTSAWSALEDTKQYSLDGGLKWVTFPNAETGWTTKQPNNDLTIDSGEWDLRVRYLDRAGNEGTQRSQKIHVNSVFPKLISVSAEQPNGWYTSNAGSNSLTFNLNFADAVRVATAANVTITVTNRAASNTHNPAGTTTGTPATDQSFQYTVAVATGQTSITRDGASTVKFTWNNISGKEMRDGLYISAITITGLMDRFSNAGVNLTNLPWDGKITTDCANLPWTATASIKVDAIAPTATYTPANAGVLTVADKKTITMVFNEPVMIGTGKITVKPHGDYLIPAVFENEGYTNDAGTYIAGFSDIYNNSALDSTDRNNLSQGTSMSKLTVDTRTGQSAGPYIKMTQGLKVGLGFTGNNTPGPGYTNNTLQPESMPQQANSLVPDTATKWVLDYRYSINNNNNTQYANTSNVLTNADNTVVTKIRAVLTKAKWRWQEMELASSVEFSGDKKTVTITLNEPLLDGLQWDLGFPAGAFTDQAGNPVAAESAYWFWSRGVQTPVIRVNRKSFDARTASWNDFTRAYSVPADRNSPGGWGIGDFNTIHYKIETETPGAAIWSGTQRGTAANGGSITGAWTGNIGAVSGNQRTWQNPEVDNTAGEWVLRNLIRRSGAGGARTYIVSENGFNTTRSITADYKGYRSYNRDILRATLIGTTLTNTGSTESYQGNFTYDALQASKDYVVAQARITNGTAYTSELGYEGVFRSVVALNQTAWGGNLTANLYRNPVMVQGSNVKNGMPSIAGFPVYDAEESGDNRYVKLFYYEGRTTAAAGDTGIGAAHLYWVSTEIVSQWYELNCGRRNQDNDSNGGTHQSRGDVNNYILSGYGDLSYAKDQR